MRVRRALARDDVPSGQSARQRAAGPQLPIYQGGALVGTERQYSDRLLEFLLRARRPKVFVDRTRHQMELGEMPHFGLSSQRQHGGGITLARLYELVGEADDDRGELEAAEVAEFTNISDT